MYMVTMKRPGYCLFATTPSGRFAAGVTNDQKRLHALLREGNDWTTVRDWPVEEFSHTELMLKLDRMDEPADPREILKLLPDPRALH
jgi:hypothetical protein